MPEKRETFSVKVAGLERELKLFSVAPKVQIAIVNILQDTELVQASAKELAKKLNPFKPQALVTAEAKSIPLAYALSVEMKIPFIVLRKSYKPYMGEALRSETFSITTGKAQTLFLDEQDRERIKDSAVIIVDDVISTGSTLQGMRLIAEKAGANIVAEAAIFTEGDRAKWKDVISLGHLPVFIDKTNNNDES